MPNRMLGFQTGQKNTNILRFGVLNTKLATLPIGIFYASNYFQRVVLSNFMAVLVLIHWLKPKPKEKLQRSSSVSYANSISDARAFSP